MNSILIRKIEINELQTALGLIITVFNQFEAPEYSKEGIENFYGCNQPEFVKPLIESGAMKMWGAFSDGNLVGVIAVRNENHICRFFVDADHHKRGIGRKLFGTVLSHIKEIGKNEMTVFSSPYAVPVYQCLGFVDTDDEQLSDGMRYIPMKYCI